MAQVMDAPRPTHELAADVRDALPVLVHESLAPEATPWFQALDALVARVTDLEAQVASLNSELSEADQHAGEWIHKAEAAEAQVETLREDLIYQTRESNGRERRRLAAEAQVAALAADLERAMTAAEKAIERGNTAANGWLVAKDEVAALTRSEAIFHGAMEKAKARAEAAEAALATTRQALTEVSNAYGCFAGCTGGMPDAPPGAHTPACTAARRALAATEGEGE